MNHGEVKRSKIFVEWEVLQIIVDVEKESIFEILWWFNIGYPVKFIYNKNSLLSFKKYTYLR
jgi:hypothetical protein